MDQTEIVKLAYHLILGRAPGPSEDEHVKRISQNIDIDLLRKRFFSSKEYRYNDLMTRLLPELYSIEEEENRYNADKFESFMSSLDLENKVREIISHRTDAYSRFHAKRFFDQIRALSSIRTKYFGHLQKVRVLEVGPASVSRMYEKVIDGLEFYTAGIPPDKGDLATIHELYGSEAHYFVNLEDADISGLYPALIAQPFHIIIMCEVVEHVRASPKELLSDLFRILTPDGAILLSTPNARSEDRMRKYLLGELPQEVYEKSSRGRYSDYHMHVREFTMMELKSAIVSAGGQIDFAGISDYFSTPTSGAPREQYVSARDQLSFLISKAGVVR
jgi:SAM-dependent methyltransferase